MFEKQCLLKKKIILRENFTTTSLAVVFLQFVSLILRDPPPRAYLSVFYTIRAIISYH